MFYSGQTPGHSSDTVILQPLTSPTKLLSLNLETGLALGNDMRSILAVGLDAGLLHTRAAVLRRTNAEVTQAEPEAAIGILKLIPFDVVLLCHTLSVVDSIRITQAARQCDACVLQVVTGALWSPSYDDVPVDGLCEADPVLLLDRVGEALKMEAKPISGTKLLRFRPRREKVS